MQISQVSSLEPGHCKVSSSHLAAVSTRSPAGSHLYQQSPPPKSRTKNRTLDKINKRCRSSGRSRELSDLALQDQPSPGPAGLARDSRRAGAGAPLDASEHWVFVGALTLGRSVRRAEQLEGVRWRAVRWRGWQYDFSKKEELLSTSELGAFWVD